MSKRKERIAFCLKTLSDGLVNERNAKWIVAEMLCEIQTEEYWRDLKYPSFSAFVGKETDLDITKAQQRVRDFEKALSLRFTPEELKSKGYSCYHIRKLFDMSESEIPKAIKLLRSKGGSRKFGQTYLKGSKRIRSVDSVDLRRTAIVLNASSAEVAEETKKLLQDYCLEKKEVYNCDALLSLLQKYHREKRITKVKSRGLLLPRSRVGSEVRI
jgi:hypothetical protein